MTFEEFLDAELTGLRRYATVLTGDPQRAHDVLADALLRAHTGWSRIGRMELPLAYVRRMVTSTFLSEQRRWSVRYIRLTRSGELPDEPMPDSVSAVDDRAALHDLLAALPPRQRAAVVLRYYLGLDTDAVAAELGITPGAARTAISRALAAMRVTIADAEPETVADAGSDTGAAGTTAATRDAADRHRAAGTDGGEAVAARPQPLEGS